MNGLCFLGENLQTPHQPIIHTDESFTELNTKGYVNMMNITLIHTHTHTK